MNFLWDHLATENPCHASHLTQFLIWEKRALGYEQPTSLSIYHVWHQVPSAWLFKRHFVGRSNYQRFTTPGGGDYHYPIYQMRTLSPEE